MTGARRHLGDRIAAGILLIVSLVLLLTSIRYRLFDGNAPGPGLFPAIIAAGLVLLAVMWLITGAGSEITGSTANVAAEATPRRAKAVTGRSRIEDSPSGPDMDADSDEHLGAPDDVVIDAAGRLRILFVIVWTLVPLLLLERLGYMIAISVYVGGLLAAVARVRPWVAVIASLAGAVLTQIGADQLGINLPDPLHLLQIFGL